MNSTATHSHSVPTRAHSVPPGHLMRSPGPMAEAIPEPTPGSTHQSPEPLDARTLNVRHIYDRCIARLLGLCDKLLDKTLILLTNYKNKLARWQNSR